MELRPKHVAARVMTRTPAYRLLPPGSVRTYAGLRYHAENSTPEQIAEFVRRAGAPVTRYPATALVAANGALRTGQDDLLERILDDAQARFPDNAGFYRLRAVFAGFRGDHAEGLALARRARLLDPSSYEAAIDEVRLSYVVLDESVADEVAIKVLARFPRQSQVLWAVAKECRSSEQYERIESTWRDRAKDPNDLVAAVRQLATAAGRAGRTDDAIEWYRGALEQLLAGTTTTAAVRDARLEGKGAWSAIEDLVELLDGADVPFFFAAGTALGLVREGRPLALDGDIDVGLFESDYDLEQLTELFRRHPRFEFDVVHPSTKKLGLKHRGGSPVDIFRFYEEGDHIWHDAVFVRWRNTPFTTERIDVNGIAAPIPAEADRYLTENYGDWRRPNPAFDAFTDDAPNMEVTWAEYHRLHLVRRAYKALTAGDRTGMISFLQAAQLDDLAQRVVAQHG